MSIAFSQTSSPYRGAVQLYEKAILANYGDVSGNSELLGQFTTWANLALDNYHLLWASAAGTWQGDDQNFTNYPIVTANIVSGQRDYQITNDGTNRIVDVSAVLILSSSTATEYELLPPIDELIYPKSEILINTTTGRPFQYGKLSNAIFLDPVPNYSVNNGIKMVVNREGSYFLTTDTTKIPGVPAYHEYFYLKPAYEYARIHGLSNLAELEKAVIDLEGSERLRITGKIKEFFSQRERDVRKIMTHKKPFYI